MDGCATGLYVVDGIRDCALTGLNAVGCGTGFMLEGQGNTLIRPGAFGCGVGVQLNAQNKDNTIIAPRFRDNEQDWKYEPSAEIPLMISRDDRPRVGVKPAVSVFETFPRGEVGNDFTPSLPSGREKTTPIFMYGGVPVTSISFTSADIPLVNGCNQWFALRRLDRTLLAQTVDDGAAPWEAFKTKRLALREQLVVPETGWYLVSVMVNAQRPPNLVGKGTPQILNQSPPVYSGYTGDTGLTLSAPDVAAPIAAGPGNAYVMIRSD
jgi:hypothetical protein